MPACVPSWYFDVRPWVLKNFWEELAPIVDNIICSSITQSKYPSLYKHALITPVPKVNPPRDIGTDLPDFCLVIYGKSPWKDPTQAK
jgi:hypothetical protein